MKFVDFIMECDVSRSILINDKLHLTVFDENSSRKDAFLGKGSISLRKIAACSLGSKIDIPLQLTDEKGVVCSNAVVQCVLSPGSVNIEKLISDNAVLPLGSYYSLCYHAHHTIALTLTHSLTHSEHGKLIVSKVVLSDIFKSETTLNAIVPYVLLHFNDWKLQTKAVDITDKKQDVIYSAPQEIPADLSLLANGDELKINQLQITVKDQNMVTSDTVVGSVLVSLRKLVTSPTIGKDQVIIAKLKEPKRGRVVGRVAITARIEPQDIPKQTLLGILLTH